MSTYSKFVHSQEVEAQESKAAQKVNTRAEIMQIHVVKGTIKMREIKEKWTESKQ